MPAVMARMAYARHGVHLLLVHGRDAPRDEEWSAYLADMERWLAHCVGVLITSEGGGPNSGQRRALRDLMARMTVPGAPTAVVSSSLLVRGIVIALSVFDAKIRVFKPDDLDAALAYIRVTSEQRPGLLAAADRLRRGLGE
jgi:hypothetical protein